MGWQRVWGTRPDMMLIHGHRVNDGIGWTETRAVMMAVCLFACVDRCVCVVHPYYAVSLFLYICVRKRMTLFFIRVCVCVWVHGCMGACAVCMGRVWHGIYVCLLGSG